ncbi:MAG: trypsin-like peptidase domain-containing protein [Symploca sp. SIO2E6]|nr:trypsin-like peptidase domain-containing protein [Symploca sp. SIO2E6]
MLEIIKIVTIPHLKLEYFKQLQQRARAITVKVLSGLTWSSGIIIHRRGQLYTVLTNRHILTSTNTYQIQTADSHIHQAFTLQNKTFSGYDLALLQFRSNNPVYTVASFGGSSQLRLNQDVFAAGFPHGMKVDGREIFVLTKGEVSLLLPKPMKKGYQIGYTNHIQKGMSGGPLLNCQGEVVGINGIHAFPLWGNPYIYQDGSLPSSSLRQQMRHYSWGIPIETFHQLIDPQTTGVAQLKMSNE